MEDDMITKGVWDTFLTIEGERLLLVKRKHPFVVLFPIALTSLVTTIFVIGSFFFFTTLVHSFPLFIVTTLLLISLALSLITKNIIDWYFHMYILTTKKILEISYNPLSSRLMNDVLLDHVNCTEVDLRTQGFFGEILGIGDVVVTFDRPTKQEEFVFRDVKEGHSLGRFLTKQLIDRHTEMMRMQPIWFRGYQKGAQT